MPCPEPVHRGILAADIEEFARLDRTDPVRVHLRERLHSRLDRALTAARIDPALIACSDHGDSVLVLVDPTISLARLLHPLVPRLAQGLERSNRRVAPPARLRLRLALHHGQVLTDRYGHTGEALNHAFRLLDAQVVRAVLAEVPTADMVLVASEAVYQAVIRHSYGHIDPASYQPVQVISKETRARAWVHLPRLRVQPQLDGKLGELASRPRTDGYPTSTS